MPKRKSFEEAKSEIESVTQEGTILLSTEYISNRKPLLFKCECGRTFQRTFAKYMNGSHKCPECKKEYLSEKYRLSIESVKKIVSEAGCEYISGEYLNNQSILTLRCSCGEIFQKRLIKFRSGQNRCAKCGFNSIKGVNSPFYKGGCSSVYLALRESVNNWKQDVRDFYEDTCPITGETGELCVVHHLVSFESIYTPIAAKYGVKINYKTQIIDLPSYEIFDEIRKEVLAAHTLDMGILISERIHNEYHTAYRKRTCNEENFASFLSDNYGVNLSDIRRKT